MAITFEQHDVVDRILSAQGGNGAFVSFATSPAGTVEDCNGCITGLVVRAIGHGPLPGRLHAARERALDYLERCERSAAPGSYGFWPESDRPHWAPELPADADDTALIAVELFRAQRRSLEALRRVALLTLLPFRVRDSERGQDPAWVRPGVFRTWLADGRPNPVDCVANVNIAALLAQAGLTHIAAYRAVVSMLAAAVAAADGAARTRAPLLAPFYAHPAELRWALAHAVASGASALAPSLARVASWCADATAPDADRPVCCSAYGRRVWTAPILHRLRHHR
jgi:hypothetical protein